MGLTTAVLLAAAPAAGHVLRVSGGPTTPGPLLACVQVNIPQSLKDSTGLTWQDYVRRVLTGVKEASRAGADVVVLPETLFPADIVRGADPAARFRDGRPIRELLDDERELLAVLRKHLGPTAWLLTGVKLYDRVDPTSDRLQLFNSALLYNASGEETARYDKRYLVPGAEELVLIPEGWLADAFRQALDPYTHGMVPEMVPGPGAAVFEFPRGTARLTPRAALAICYDNAFASHFRDGARLGANFHLVLSNEGWFPDSFEMDAMLAYSSFRAIESRRSIVRCTNTGISCLVEPDGVISQVFERDGRRSEVGGVLTVRPNLCESSTVYQVLGDAPAVAAAALAFALAFLLRRRRSLLEDAPKSP
jgi:apolipoprotein N-acyltransferase